MLFLHFTLAGPQAERQQPEAGAFRNARGGDAAGYHHQVIVFDHMPLLVQ